MIFVKNSGWPIKTGTAYFNRFLEKTEAILQLWKAISEDVPIRAVRRQCCVDGALLYLAALWPGTPADLHVSVDPVPEPVVSLPHEGFFVLISAPLPKLNAASDHALTASEAEYDRIFLRSPTCWPVEILWQIAVSICRLGGVKPSRLMAE